MAENRKNAACTDGKHEQHLCYLQYEGYHVAHAAEYKALVHAAEYICRNCGRTAASAASLCAPAKL